MYINIVMSIILLLYATEPGVCDEGDARLVDGDIEQEGRLEVCMNGVWGTVCSSSFDTTDAYVACKQLNRGSTTGIPQAIIYSP